MNLISNYNVYLDNFKGILSNIEDFFGMEQSIFNTITQYFEENIPKFFDNGGINQIAETILQAFPGIFDATKSFASSVTNTIIGFAMSIYILASRDRLLYHCKKLVYAFTPKKAADKMTEIAALTSNVFGNYINGQLLDALVVGIICFIGLTVFGFSYAPLISVIVAVTNIIPIFGPFLGAIPSAFILLMVDPKQAFFFIIFILIVQQIDGNIIVPRIVGDSIGLPPLWVMLAIIVGGGLLGILGMIIGVPTTAVIYKLLRSETTKRLKHKKVLEYEYATAAPDDKNINKADSKSDDNIDSGIDSKDNSDDKSE